MIAVASGKGGVGKSSLTVNLAAALADQGQEVGVIDADVYGHSIPHMLGTRQRPVLVDRMMIPVVAHGLHLMSIGFFLDDNQPVMWRGPMLHRALEQFLSDVHWPQLDTILVDMPPGTGDVSISLGQLLPRAEVVVVTTPQPLAQEVAARAATMAQKTSMRLLGVVENMSGGVFGAGGGLELAAGARDRAARLGPARRSAAAGRGRGPPGRLRRPGLGGRAGDRRRSRSGSRRRSASAASARSSGRCPSSPSGPASRSCARSGSSPVRPTR